MTDLRIGERAMAIILPRCNGGLPGAGRRTCRSVVRSPDWASDAEASTLPMNGLTTRLALDLLGLRSGQTLAVTGAAGAVGGYAVELGVIGGFR